MAGTDHTSFYLYRQRKRNSKVRTYTDEIVGLFGSLLLSRMFLFGFSIRADHGSGVLQILQSCTIGALWHAYFSIGHHFESARAHDRRHRLLAVVDTGSRFVPYDYQLLMLPLAVIVAWIVPGYLLQAKHKKENA